MQMVILAAGRGTRMGILTDTTPKPLLEAAGKSLLQHKLDIIPETVREVIIVVGYLGDKIISKIGDNAHGRPIKYFRLKEILGTGHAIHAIKSFLDEKFMVVMGDDIYSKKDFQKMSERDFAVLAKKVEKPMRGAKMEIDESGRLKDIVERAELSPGDFINTGCYTLSREFLSYPLVKIPGQKEYGLPQTLAIAARDHDVEIVKADFWLPVTSPEDLVAAEKIFYK